MTTGEKIAYERGKLGLTQQQFANELGVTRQAVSRWESDISFPETDKLIKMSELFGCSIDYLIKYNSNGGAQSDSPRGDGREDDRTDGKRGVFNPMTWHFEYKSEKQLCGMPLVHVNIGFGRKAHGFFSFGLISSGVFSFGLLSAGVVSVGILSLGAITFGCIALGLLAFAAIALGIVAFGAVAIGVIALGGVAIGCFGLGGCAIGAFACGGYANGSIVAVGDYAVGNIALGKTTATGNTLSATLENFEAQKEEAWRLLDEIPAFWQGFVRWCKSFADACMRR